MALSQLHQPAVVVVTIQCDAKPAQSRWTLFSACQLARLKNMKCIRLYGQCHLDIDDLKIKVTVDFTLVTPETLTVTGVDFVVFASGSTMTDRDPHLRQCAEYQALRVCARFEVLRAEELAASILGVSEVQVGYMFQNTYCVS
jgi:hypothetical protein